MSWTYSCPHCGQILNPDETVILIAHVDRRDVLIGFHPQPGNYTIYLPQGVDLKWGVGIDFYCPLCRTNLESRSHENFCELVIWQGRARRRILFSRIAGEHATYVVQEEPKAKKAKVEERHGEHTDRYNITLTFAPPKRK